MPWMDPLTSGVNISGLGGSVSGILFSCFALGESCPKTTLRLKITLSINMDPRCFATFPALRRQNYIAHLTRPASQMP